MIEVRLVATDGNITDHKIKGNLKDYYELIGCSLIELVYVDDQVLVVDEEGLLKADPVKNLTASAYAKQPIYGNVIIMAKKDFT